MASGLLAWSRGLEPGFAFLPATPFIIPIVGVPAKCFARQKRDRR